MDKQISVYAAVNAEDTVRLNSSSGGVFTLLAQTVLDAGGAVFGAAVTEDMQIAHICITDPEELWRLRGSKYVRSSMAGVYTQVKEQLQTGRPVLFTGTACQVGGLHAFLKEEYDNLLCQDLICHGAPEASVWKQYVAYREKKAGAKAISINFRDKSTGWRDYCLKMTFENGNVYQQSVYKDPYMRAFLRDLSLGLSCYQCAFKGLNRQADITLGDFWGVEQVVPELDDNQGVSVVFIHTEKGQRMLQQIMPKLKLVPVPAEAAVRQNPAMLHAAKRPENRERFLQELSSRHFESVVNKYCPRPTLMRRVIRKIKRLVGKLR